jgi:hypothetical protein
VRVNFQSYDAAVPQGYLSDSGAVFGGRANGYSYGWSGANNTGKDRNSATSPDQRYDTLVHMQKSSLPNATWEIVLPDGVYQVHLVAGDASYFDSVYRINVEGVLAVSGTPTSANRWIEGTVTVTVTDGRLTISNGAGAVNNKINFVDITRVD